MKKAIATALALLLTSCGYVLVDQKLVDRVTSLESQVEELQNGQNTASPTTTGVSTSEEAMDEWDVPCNIDLPCSFISKTGPGVITITKVTAHCVRNVVESSSSRMKGVEGQANTNQDEYYAVVSQNRDLKEETTRRANKMFLIFPDEFTPEEESSIRAEEESSKHYGEVPDPVTAPPYSGDLYEPTSHYETTIQIQGYVSKDFLTGGKTIVHIRRLCCTAFFSSTSWYTRSHDFDVDLVPNCDGLFSKTIIIPYNVRSVDYITFVSAE